MKAKDKENGDWDDGWYSTVYGIKLLILAEVAGRRPKKAKKTKRKKKRKKP